MKRKTVRALGLDNRRNLPRPANLASRLERLKVEADLISATIGDALERIRAERTREQPSNDA